MNTVKVAFMEREREHPFRTATVTFLGSQKETQILPRGPKFHCSRKNSVFWEYPKL